MIATFGFGRSAIAHRRSTMSCSAGASSRSTTFAPDASSASLAEVKYWKIANAADDHDADDEAAADDLDQDQRRR